MPSQGPIKLDYSYRMLLRSGALLTSFTFSGCNLYGNHDAICQSHALNIKWLTEQFFHNACWAHNACVHLDGDSTHDNNYMSDSLTDSFKESVFAFMDAWFYSVL